MAYSTAREAGVDAVKGGSTGNRVISFFTDVCTTTGTTYTSEVIHPSATATTTNSNGKEAQHSKDQEDTTRWCNYHINGTIPAKLFV